MYHMSLEIQLDVIDITDVMLKQNLDDLPQARTDIKKLLTQLSGKIQNNKTITDNWKKEMLNRAINAYRSNTDQNFFGLFACITNIALFFTDENEISDMGRF